MDDPTEEPLYEMVLGMVLWGEPREEVFHRLQVNGITGDRAERIYATAWEERLTVIRRDYGRKAGTGLLLMIGAAAIFCGFWFGVRVIPRLPAFRPHEGRGDGGSLALLHRHWAKRWTI